MIKFTLRQLEHFSTAARLGSLAAAARELGMTPAAIAASLAKLEQVSGLKLFDRFPAQGIVLTASGREVLQAASDLLAQGEQLQAGLQGLEQRRRGHIRFGCYPVLAYVFAPPILMLHGHQWPEVRLEVFETHFQEMQDLLHRGEVDLILTYDQGLDRDAFDILPLAEVRPKVLLSAQHVLARRAAVSLQDLEGMPYLLVQDPSVGPGYLDLLRQAGLDPEVALVTRSYELARSCVGKGLGFTLMAFQPPNPVTYHGDAVVAVPLSTDLGPQSIVLASRKGAGEQPLISDFIRSCQEVLAAQTPAPPGAMRFQPGL